MAIIEAAMPTAMAPIMSVLRIGLRFRLRRASRTSCMSMCAPSGRRADGRLGRAQRIELVYLVDLPIDDVHLPVCFLRELRVVRHHENRRAARIDRLQQLHDL